MRETICGGIICYPKQTVQFVRMSTLREAVLEFLENEREPCSAIKIAKYVMGLEGTSRDVTRILMDLEQEGLVKHYETRPHVWIKTIPTPKL